MYYDYYNQDFFTSNRKLVLKEYDDDGNIIEEREFSNVELAKFLSIIRNDFDFLKVARYKYIKQFTDKELIQINTFIDHMSSSSLYNGGKVIGLDSEEDTKFYKELFKMPKDKINLALQLSTPKEIGGGFNTLVSSPYSNMNLSFDKALEFIDSREGIYYTVNNEGIRRWDFVDKPTLKQYRYQLRKNRERTVFLSFNDWKEYIVNECDLL